MPAAPPISKARKKPVSPNDDLAFGCSIPSLSTRFWRASGLARSAGRVERQQVWLLTMSKQARDSPQDLAERLELLLFKKLEPSRE